jgi:hypothetical protein
MSGKQRCRLADFLALAVLAVPLTLRAADRPDPAPAHESVRQISSRHGLTLVYKACNDDLSQAVLPYLTDLAAVYGPEGLAVVVIGFPAGVLDSTSDSLLFLVADDDGDDASGAVLTMRRRDGVILAAMQEAALDLYAAYRICEIELLGRGRSTLAEHIERVIESLIRNECVAAQRDGGKDVALSDLLRDSRRGCLLVPPGCGVCVLERSAAALGRLFREHGDIPALVFDSDAGPSLRSLGWQGKEHLLPADSETRLLGLRQAGNYQPVLVFLHDRDGVEVRSVRAVNGS